MFSQLEYQSESMVMLTIRLRPSNIPVGVTVTVKVHPVLGLCLSLLAPAWPGDSRSEMESSTVLLLSLTGPGRGSEKRLREGVGWRGGSWC